MKQPSIQPVENVSPVTPDWLTNAESERLVASMEFWYPRLQTVDGIQTPETAWVSLEPDVIEEGTIHEHYWANYDANEVREAVKSVGGPPAFLRTDQASDIYDMEYSSKIRSLSTKEIETSVGGVIGFNAMRAEVPFSSLAVREWLDIDYFFTAWDGKKVGVEIRTFVSNGEVESWCFDWPRNQLQPDVEGWEELYQKTQTKAEERVSEILPQAQKVAERFEDAGSGEWSVDFVLTTEDGWYCTDMAPKRMSQVASNLHTV